MSRSTVAKKPIKKVVIDDHPAKLDVLLDSLRSMWLAAETETNLTQSLHATIAKTNEKLEQSVCGKLKLAIALDGRNTVPISKLANRTRIPQVLDKAIYEKGGLNSANLTDELQIEAEDDYRICARRGSDETGKAKTKKRKPKGEA